VTTLPQPANEIRSDEATSSNNDDLHDFSPVWRPSIGLAGGECAGADWKALQRHWIAIEFPLEFRPRIAIKDSHQG
jgi:hypothetical protein